QASPSTRTQAEFADVGLELSPQLARDRRGAVLLPTPLALDEHAAGRYVAVAHVQLRDTDAVVVQQRCVYGAQAHGLLQHRDDPAPLAPGHLAGARVHTLKRLVAGGRPGLGP